MSLPTLAELEEAANWLDDAADGWSPQQRSAFLAWLAEQPARLEAVQCVARAMADPMLDAALREAMTSAPPTAEPSRQRPALMAMAACVAMLVLGAGGWIWLQRGDHLLTPAGGAVVRHLADGSTVHLDGRSELTIHLRAHTRDLDLTQGSALFEVAHAPNRPFTVRSGDVAVTAVGTVFEVSQVGAATMVRVEQGRVRVASGGMQRTLDVGHGLYLTPGQPAQELPFPADPVAATHGWLDAQGDRLDTVLARLARATTRRVDCAPELAARPISGRYRLDDPEGSLRLIALANGWQVVAGDGGWHLRPG